MVRVKFDLTCIICFSAPDRPTTDRVRTRAVYDDVVVLVLSELFFEPVHVLEQISLLATFILVVPNRFHGKRTHSKQ